MSTATDMDKLIRGATGGTPVDRPAEASNDRASDAQREAATLAGIPVEHAHRLEGDTRQELVTDARRFAEDIGAEHTGSDAGVHQVVPAADHGMDDMIRGRRLADRQRAVDNAEMFRRERAA